jgi:hypothetical protein
MESGGGRHTVAMLLGILRPTRLSGPPVEMLLPPASELDVGAAPF